MKITLDRGYLPDGTFGTWYLERSATIWECKTVERPWLDNQRNISCIPEGTYRIFRSEYHRGGYECFEVDGVYGRSLIKIHVANWPKDVEGCIGLGREIVPLNVSGNPVLAVSSSRDTFNEWMQLMDGIDEAELLIRAKSTDMMI